MRFVHVPMGTFSQDCFESLGPQVKAERLEDLRVGDVLVLWGGEDISPELYGEKPAHTYADKISRRDAIETKFFDHAVEQGNPIVGICRGAQLACALSGGKLFQHIQHPSTHPITCNDGKIRNTNSVHHQMMRPENTNHEMVAWSIGLSPIHLTEDDDVFIEREPEIVWFKDTKALAIQGHPEFVHNTHPFRQYCLSLVDKYVL